jgi:hypothetical protein
MKHNFMLAMAAAFLLIPRPLGSQASGSDLTQRFLVLHTFKTATMQRELDEAASAGYRIVDAFFEEHAPSGFLGFGEGEMVVVLEKTTTPPKTYAYRLLESALRISTLEKKVNESTAQGFQLLPYAVFPVTHHFGGFFPPTEITVALMERDPDKSERSEYHFLRTRGLSSLKEQITKSVAQGYRPIHVVGDGELHIVVMAKGANSSGQPSIQPTQGSELKPSERFVVLMEGKLAKLEEETHPLAAAGYRLVAGTSNFGGLNTHMALILWKSTPTPAPCEYLFVDEKKDPSLETRLNESARLGFRLLPHMLLPEAAVMERPIGSTSVYNYLVLGFPNNPDVKEKVASAATRGYQLVGFSQRYSAIMEIETKTDAAQ